ncbi:general odorant-binding protein 45-like [Anopheles nili]|uniref:general odorant-binding protein 45-like n=1 Tax=Anopheles nili TaxID=185578 RepID=UPI00237B6841|nr:general odorant-binding protein 45-like [Anopheles nili]
MTSKRSGLVSGVWLVWMMYNSLILTAEAGTVSNCTGTTPTTFDGALQECASQLGIAPERLEKECYNLLLHPADRDSMCLVRCIGVLLRFWNDTTGLRESVIQQYYQPAPEDTCYRNRTQRCLEALEPTVTDVCERAHRSFLCYHQQFGNLVRADRYVPKTPLEMRQVQQDCLDILGLSPKRLVLYREGHFPDDAETQCFVRCVGLRTGLYSDKQGPNVDRLFVQCESCADEQVFRDRANECIASQRRHKLSKCTAAYRTLYECFRDDQLDLYASFTKTPVMYSTTTSAPVSMPPANALAGYARKTSSKRHFVRPYQLEIVLESLAQNAGY